MSHYYSPPPPPFLSLFSGDYPVLLALVVAAFVYLFVPLHNVAGLVELAQFKLSILATKLGMGGLTGLDWERMGGMLEHGEADADVEADELDVELTRRPPTPAPVAGSSRQVVYYPGLLNAAGNLCFLNATLQSLASLPPLLSYLHSLPTLPVSSSLLAVLAQLNAPSISPPVPLRPIALARALAESNPTRRRLLASGEQQDAHELWIMIREAIEEEVAKFAKTVRDGPAGGGLADLLGLGRARAGKSKAAGSPTARIPPLDPFHQLLAQSITCVMCKYKRDVRHESESQVALIVPPLLSCKLVDLLRDFTKDDYLSEYNCRRCSLLKTQAKLVTQRDNLANLPSTPALTNLTSNSSLATSTTFDLPPEKASPTKMTSSRNKRRRQVQQLVDKVSIIVNAGDWEKELGDEIKLERSDNPAVKRVRFGRTPQVLTIHLNRSAHYGYGGQPVKNTCQVEFPEWLDLAPFAEFGADVVFPSSSSAASPSDDLDSKSKSPSTEPELETPSAPLGRDIYRLTSLVVHYGSHSYGHYVAYRRRPPGPLPFPPPSTDPSTGEEVPTPVVPEWYRISDETVSPATTEQVLRSNPFLVFYERALLKNGAGLLLTNSSLETNTVLGIELRLDPDDPARSSDVGELDGDGTVIAADVAIEHKSRKEGYDPVPSK
ncbi:ubiquitin carboxyl-terminal hydrolase 16 [Pseudohyphozyma bogoriensis]|nr:ubiquitin carboxyl-terminal hydrolase 16 [Pseudohyphozyma bogoriensis]